MRSVRRKLSHQARPLPRRWPACAGPLGTVVLDARPYRPEAVVRLCGILHAGKCKRHLLDAFAVVLDAAVGLDDVQVNATATAFRGRDNEANLQRQPAYLKDRGTAGRDPPSLRLQQLFRYHIDERVE